METLCRQNLATRLVITMLDGETNAYQFRQESSVIPMLCMADEITRTYYCDFISTFRRTKPLLRDINYRLKYQPTVEYCEKYVACFPYLHTV